MAARTGVLLVPLVFGIVERLWFLANAVINSDQAVVGLMARSILHGHFPAFYWGQPYGGVEPYVVAAVFLVFGQSALTLNLAPVVLSAVAAVLVWRIARRLVDDRYLALVAGVLVWAAPETSGYLSALEYGFRGVTLVAGLGVALVALRVLDGHRRIGELALLGLLLGVGWWSSPEIMYFVLPAALLVAGAVAVDLRAAACGSGGPEPVQWAPLLRSPARGLPGLWPWFARAAAVVVAAGIAALPWIWSSAHDGWLSLHRSDFGGVEATVDYAGRFANLFHQGLAVTLGMAMTRTETPTMAQPWDQLAWVLGIAAGALTLVLCAVRGGRALAIAAAVLAFPLLWAYSPATASPGTASYGVYLPPLLALVLVIGCAEMPRAARWLPAAGGALGRQSAGRLLMVCLLLGTSALAIWDFQAERESQRVHDITGSGTTGASAGTAPGGPNAPAVEAVNAFRRAGITHGYASYWIAYKLDFLSGAGARPGLVLSPVATGACRNRAMLEAVDHSEHPAWVFVEPHHMAATIGQYDNLPVVLQGPGEEGIPRFSRYLAAVHDGARTVRAGALEAIVPAHRVVATQVGFAPASACVIAGAPAT